MSQTTVKLALTIMVTERREQSTMPTLQDELNAFMQNMMGQVPSEVLQTSRTQLDKIYQEQLPTGLTIGDEAPNFSLNDATGKTVHLADLLQLGPVVVSFYRGAWCPFCNLELRALQNALPKFNELGATLIAISPQSPDHSLSMQEKNELSFPVLSDATGATLDAYHLLYTFTPELQQLYEHVFGVNLAAYNGNLGWKLPVPATYVIDKSGIIRGAFGNMDYTKRMEPTAIIDVLQGIQSRTH